MVIKLTCLKGLPRPEQWQLGSDLILQSVPAEVTSSNVAMTVASPQHYSPQIASHFKKGQFPPKIWE